MNYKEYKQKQKEDLEVYKQKLKADLDEFKEKLKIKLEKFKLKTKAKTKNNKKKSNKRKRKGGALIEEEKQLILKFVNEIIIKHLDLDFMTDEELFKSFTNYEFIMSEMKDIKYNYPNLRNILYERLDSNDGISNERYNISIIQELLTESYSDNVVKVLIANFIILSTIGNYYDLFNRKYEITYNVVYNLFLIIDEIVYNRLPSINKTIYTEIFEVLCLDKNTLDKIIDKLKANGISGDMLKKEVVELLCKLLIPYPATDSLQNYTLSGNKKEAIKLYIETIARHLNRPSSPILKDPGEGRGAIGVLNRFSGTMEVAEDRGNSGVRGRLRGAVEIGRQISSEDDKRTKDRGMICRIDEP